ncbi:MAG: hypothetical protein ACPG5T_04470 [Endozoicomonas sp.]
MTQSIVLLLDPFFLLVAVVAVSLGRSKNYIVPLTGIFVSLLAETLATIANPGHQWGDSVLVFLASGIIQAIVAYFLVGQWRKHKLRGQQGSDQSGNPCR